LLADSAGTELLLSIDFEKLQSQILRLVSSVLVSENISSEEKQIVENALSLWIGIVNYKPSLFTCFATYTNKNQI